MRKTFELTHEQYERLLDASHPVPYLILGGCPPLSPQENANRVWQSIAQELGFDWETVRPVEGTDRQFTAEVLDVVPPGPAPG